MGVLTRRIAAKRFPEPLLYAAFLRYFADFLIPIKQALLEARADPHFPTESALFDWWVNRPGVYGYKRRVELARAYWEVQHGEGTDFSRIKTHEKAEMGRKKEPKPRTISSLSDHFVVRFAPAIQYAAIYIGRCLRPGVYETLPGRVLNVRPVWLKGVGPSELAAWMDHCARGKTRFCGEDGAEWDMRHQIPTLAMPRSLYTIFMTRETAEAYWGHVTTPYAFTSTSLVRGHAGTDTFKSKLRVSGTLNTGEPDTSCSNTLITLAFDYFRLTEACRV